jgi:hypothetical protein
MAKCRQKKETLPPCQSSSVFSKNVLTSDSVASFFPRPPFHDVAQSCDHLAKFGYRPDTKVKLLKNPCIFWLLAGNLL